jgi:hypothetical protein
MQQATLNDDDFQENGVDAQQIKNLTEGDTVVVRYNACGLRRGRDATLVRVECAEERLVTEVGTGRQLRLGTLRFPSGDTTTEMMDQDNNAREGLDVEIQSTGEYGAFA